MRIRATVTRQNQLTLPAVIRERLGLNGGGTIVFNVTDDDIRIEGREMTLDEIIANPLRLPERASDDFDVEIEEAMEVETRRFFDVDRIGLP